MPGVPSLEFGDVGKTKSIRRKDVQAKGYESVKP